ncbi:MAG: preprotein translocase subunit YajC [Candidatus Omnitrophota bacterium]|jgi:preprotein translocase subunit YajC
MVQTIMNNVSPFILLFESAGGEPPALLSFAPLVFMFGVFYFLLIRPQQRKQKAQKVMLGALVKNQQVVTTGGIHGTIVQVKEETIIVRVADQVRLEFDRAAVAAVKA